MRAKNAGFPFRRESVTDPIVIHAQSRAAFAFLATKPEKDGYWHDCGLAVFRSSSVVQLRHGHPNDEAFPGHPLYRAGVDGVDVFEIEDSPWLSEVIAVNAVRFPSSTNAYSGVRHHIFPFKETILEVLWSDFEYDLSQRPFAEVSGDLLRWVIEE